MNIILLLILLLVISFFIISLISIWNHEFRRKMWPFFIFCVLILPNIAVAVAGVVIGLMIAFSACFKQDCSASEGYAPLWIPLIALCVSIPITKRYIHNERYAKLKQNIHERNTVPLVIAILLAILMLWPLIQMALDSFYYAVG